MKSSNKKTGKIIENLRKHKKMSIRELAKMTGIGHTTIGRYEKGEHDIPINKLDLIAKSLGTDVYHLMYGVDISEQLQNKHVVPITSIAITQIPLFASISCGDLSSIDNNLVGNIEVSERLVRKYGADNLFAVKTKGDSMNKIVNEGFAAIFATNAEWHNGDAVAVLINGDEATLKKATRTDSSIILEPASYNPEHQPIFINCNEVACDEYVKIIGKLVGASMIFD